MALCCLQEDRLRGRGTETEDSLAKRLAVAKAELEYGRLHSIIMTITVITLIMFMVLSS